MPPRDLVLDASVLVAAIRPGEPFYAEARAALETLSRQRTNLFVPAIALPEVAAAIARGSGSASQAARDVRLVRRLPGLQVIAVDDALADLAADIAGLQRIRGCDAIYVALAQRQTADLVTLDSEQSQRAPTAVRTWTPGELLAAWPAS